ncbi:MAG: phosphate/phosphite/phosphonate ABC transporter substrate-binding protein [Elusimicrobiota bacterium]|nr:phosphate/phosphite/phosphonate ABC transporter substrate-binding protein [Elusimicrobiota bacterium]
MFENKRAVRRRAVYKSAVVGMLVALVWGGCSRRDEATVGTPANPLVVVFSPAHAPSASSGALAFIKKHLETASGMSVDLRAAESPAAAIKQFSAGRADAGIVTLEEYLVAREEYGVRAELQVLRGDKLAEYEGAILIRSADGPGSAAELAGRKVGFVGPYSVSGFTLPAIYLKKAGVPVASDFSPSHEANLKKLVNGEVYAAATYARQVSRYPGLRILAFTGKVPNEPVIVRRSLSPEKRKALASALLTLGGTPEGLRALGAVADITGFRPADQTAYKPLHDLILSEGKSVYDLIPGGWEIYRLNQPYYPD